MNAPSPEFLLKLLAGVYVPAFEKESAGEDETYSVNDGWGVTVSRDADGWINCIESFTSPSGEVVDFWDWPDDEALALLKSWRGTFGETNTMFNVAAGRIHQDCVNPIWQSSRVSRWPW